MAPEKPIGERLASIEADVRTLVKGQEKLFERLEGRDKDCRECREDVLERINKASMCHGQTIQKLDGKTIGILLLVVALSGGSAGALSELIAKLLGG